MENNKLYLYRASAGSGKTYTMVSTIAALLFENKNNYKKILATTFTKAAATNIKLRLAQRLYLMKQGNFNEIDSFISEYKISNYSELLANEVLESYLFNYSELNIETMDSFFFRIIQSFSKELNLSPDLKIETNEELIWDLAAKRFFNNLGSNEEYHSLLKYLVLYRIKIGKKFIIRSDIKQEVKELNNKVFNLSHIDFDIQSVLELNNDLLDLEKYFIDVYSDLEVWLKSFNVSQITRVGNNLVFKKNPNRNDKIKLVEYFSKKVIEYSTEKDIFKKDTNSMDRMEFEVIIEKFQEKYANEEKFNKIRNAYKPMFYSTAVFSAIRSELDKVKQENKIIFFSDTSEILANKLSGEDPNDIYYKLGSKYNYFLIDEFQDTSNQQWEIFRPMLIEAIQNNGIAMIVGDAKQSIYSFRDAKPTLFTEVIPNDLEFKPFLENRFLDKNFRSFPGIVEFNNFFFQEFIGLNHITPNHIIQSTYEGLQQNAQKEGEATIHFQLFPTDGRNFDKESTYKYNADLIHKLINVEGISPSDICLLFRGKTEIQEFSNYLIQNYPRIKFTSKSGLNVSSTTFYSILIESLKYLDFPTKEREINISILLAKHRNSIEDFDLSLLEVLDQDQINPFRSYFDFLLGLKFKGAYHTIVEIIGNEIIDISPQDLSTHRLIESVLEFTIDNNDVSTWNLIDYMESLSDISILRTSLNEGSIKLETIHASKGLEYKVVIMPYCHYQTASEKINAWFLPKDDFPDKYKIFNGFFSSLSNLTHHLGDEYAAEIENHIYLQELEFLNILYVAFTRAEQRLYVSCIKPTLNKDGDTLSYSSRYKITHYIDGLLTKLKEQLIESFSISFDTESKLNP